MGCVGRELHIGYSIIGPDGLLLLGCPNTMGQMDFLGQTACGPQQWDGPSRVRESPVQGSAKKKGNGVRLPGLVREVYGSGVDGKRTEGSVVRPESSRVRQKEASVAKGSSMACVSRSLVREHRPPSGSHRSPAFFMMLLSVCKLSKR
ncbi:hypothetical protein E3N88_16664 [Mikania micrantha]|uniref:Uncharacterized protein n=1 Tax=Mikania micrantha TaxID=192012 RepID=A0A5N6NZ17_9ASTR|nr:hypothetical protein E3N88_16664 [Mikania micrantha]